MKTSLPSLLKGFALLAGLCFCLSVTAQQEIVQNGIRFSLNDDGTAAAGEVVEIQDYSSYPYSAENWQPVDTRFSIVVPAYVRDADGKRYAVTSISERFTWTDTLHTAAFVVFPSTVKSIDFTFMASHKCINVVCGAVMPPAVVNPGYANLRYALFVPKSSIWEYTVAWKNELFHSSSRVLPMYTYTKETNEDGTLSITKLSPPSGSYHPEFFSDIEIPQQIDGVPVTKVMGYSLCAYSIIVPEGITEFTGAHPQTTEIILPSSIKVIPMHCFHSYNYRKYHLKYVHLSEGLESIGEGAFTHCFELQQFTIPSTVNHIGDGQSCLYSIESFEVAEGNKYFTTRDGVLYTHDMTILKQYPSGKTNSTFSVPEGVKTISAWGLEDLQHLRVLRLLGPGLRHAQRHDQRQQKRHRERQNQNDEIFDFRPGHACSPFSTKNSLAEFRASRREIKCRSFFPEACTSEKILIGLQVWKLAVFARPIDARSRPQPFVEKLQRNF